MHRYMCFFVEAKLQKTNQLMMVMHALHLMCDEDPEQFSLVGANVACRVALLTHALDIMKKSRQPKHT